MRMIEIPTSSQIEDCIKQFNEEQATAEKAISTAFRALNNSDPENILIKVILLNDLYSAGLNSNAPGAETLLKKRETGKKLMPGVMLAAEKICAYERECRFDGCASKADAAKLIADFVVFDAPYSKPYSFITKYCSFRLPELQLPIADNYVRALLLLLNEKLQKENGIGFNEPFKNADLNDYSRFCGVVENFTARYAPDRAAKDVDKFLWQYAKNLKNRKENGMDIRTLIS